MSDGELRDSDNLVFEHIFYYRQSDLDELKRKQEEERLRSALDPLETQSAS
jgi:hypothetical protein